MPLTHGRRFVTDRYINPLTDFGFKRIFGTEPNKALLVDFLNVVLPEKHRISELSYRNSENVGNSALDRKAIFDLYCQSNSGERFIVEIQKAKQNFFKDRSVYYSTFPIQEQAIKGDFWNYHLSPVYTVGILDFIFDDHKDDETLLHTVELKDQQCRVFYDKLKFIYLELPKFQKPLEALETHFDKWLYLLRHLPSLNNPPELLQESTFMQLFEIAEIANFTPVEQVAYEDSLKYYRDLNNVVDTSRQEGLDQGAIRVIILVLAQRFGQLPDSVLKAIQSLAVEDSEALVKAQTGFDSLSDLSAWLERMA
ncbi:MAG: Rpn family recombination-promoting nuclease/putative transposase [Phormidesmis sp.]